VRASSIRVRGNLVAVVAALTATAIVVGDVDADEPEPFDPCSESLHRADAAVTTTIVARPVTVADAGAPCAASGTRRERGCVVGVVRHGATCAPIAGTQVELATHAAVTDGSGAYRLCGIGRGQHELVVPVIGATRKVRAGDVVDVDSTFLGDLGIRLAVTSVVTFAIDRVVAGPTLASPVTVFIQPSPPPGAAPAVALEDVRPAPAIGAPLELRVARDAATGVLVSETCWLHAPATTTTTTTTAPTPTPDAAPAPGAPVRRPPPRSCAHCGAADPATGLLPFAALLGAGRRRR
jgi:uncharacterized protein (TIGR03382 family)